jgi:adenylate cyclase class 2
MYTEVEAKLKVESHKEIVEKLKESGAEFSEEQSQIDYYFDDQNHTLTRTDRCLRLRQQKVGIGEKMFLTFKGAKEKTEFKKRDEIEIEVSSADSAEELLSVLGYERVLVFAKKRRTWRLGECQVALDELPLLGRFVEIEGPDAEKIADVQTSLGLGNLRHISESYAALVAEKLAQQSRR